MAIVVYPTVPGYEILETIDPSNSNVIVAVTVVKAIEFNRETSLATTKFSQIITDLPKFEILALHFWFGENPY